jgi:hypothetical protein
VITPCDFKFLNILFEIFCNKVAFPEINHVDGPEADENLNNSGNDHGTTSQIEIFGH